MDFHYAEDFGDDVLPEAYERLLLDAMQGDASLFSRGDEIELAWTLIDDILAFWDDPEAPALCFYEQGSWGPEEADEILTRHDRKWYQDCGMHHAEKR